MKSALTIGLLAAALAGSAAVAAPAAYYPSLGYGQAPPPARWDVRRRLEPPRDHRHFAVRGDMRLPASFFVGDGGVGPAYVEGGWSSGRFVVVGEARSSAFASARASARAFSSGCRCR